jgi:hypothetical protein
VPRPVDGFAVNDCPVFPTERLLDNLPDDFFVSNTQLERDINETPTRPAPSRSDNERKADAAGKEFKSSPDWDQVFAAISPTLLNRLPVSKSHAKEEAETFAAAGFSTQDLRDFMAESSEWDPDG